MVGGRGKRFALVEWCSAFACARVLSRRLGRKKVLEKNSPEKKTSLNFITATRENNNNNNNNALLFFKMASGKKKKASSSSSSSSSKTASARNAGGKGERKSNNDDEVNASETNGGAIQLPRKEGDLFNDALISYEQRKFKDALHAIEKILKKFPNHGETLCMKGLITRHCELKPNEKEEERKKKAHEFVSVGVKNNIFSHVCWHVYGLLHKADRNYKEASKCYSQALKIDPNNFLVVRDLAQAHLMLREMDEYVDARRKLFELKMGQPGSSDRANQIVIGLFMSEKWEECLEMLNEFEKFDTMDRTRRNGELLAKKKEIPEPTYEDTFQESEILLFRAVVLEKMGKVDECVELLEKNEKKIVDDAARLTQLCRLKIAKGDATAAREIAENDLVNRMPDNEKFHELMHESMNTKVSLMEPPMKRSEEDIAKLKTLYDALQKKHAKSSVCKRYPLQIVNDSSEFESLLAEYIQKPLRKGVPSLFADISSLYGGIHDEEKSIGKVLKAAADSLKKSGKFPSSSDNKDDVLEAKPKETHRYALNLLAMHYAKIGKIDEALKCIDEAIEAKDENDGDNDGEQEKVLEFHLNKSRFLKRAGDLEGAYEESEIARNMDLADRYINSVSVKRAFQCGKFREAERLGTLFTRDAENYKTNLFDMQCNWYAYEAGHSHEKFEKNTGRALKYYREIRTHCEQIIEDQIDFHRYCVNVKRTLRSFMDTLKMCDDIYASAWFKKAARRAILICVDMHDDPLEAKKVRVEAKLSKLDQEERKKERQKTRKEEEKKEKEVESFEKLLAEDLKRARETKAKRTGKPVSENSSNTTTTNNNKDSNNNNSAIEKEYLEEKYGAKAFAQASKDPMEEALSFMNPLLMSAKNDEDVNVQSLVFLVHFKRQKWVLATKALRKMAKCAPKNPLTHRCVDSLSRAIASIENEIEKQVVQSTISSLNVDKVNVQCKTLVDAAHLSVMKNDFEKALLGAVDPRKTSWKECRDALEVFERSGNATFYEQFHKACTSAFPSKSNKSKEHPSVISAAAFARVGVEDSVRSAPFL